MLKKLKALWLRLRGRKPEPEYYRMGHVVGPPRIYVGQAGDVASQFGQQQTMTLCKPDGTKVTFKF